jgi:hypothetical protein
LPAVLFVSLGAGCGGGEGVRSYTVPRTTEPGGPGAAAGEYRILGAAYPAEAPVWYFKLTGTADELAKYEAGFDKLAASVRLQGDTVPAFVLPEGWVLGGPREVTRMGVTVRFDQTVRLGPPEAPLEVTVSKSGGGIAGNVDRWAKQVGIPVVPPAEVGKYAKEFQADGVKGIRVDVRGPLNPAGGKPPFAGGR